MTTNLLRTALGQSHAAVRVFGICLPVGLAGCSYLETQLARTAPPDNRIVLDWQERRSLSEREIRRYTCPSEFLLTCERGGAVTYSCTCQMR